MPVLGLATTIGGAVLKSGANMAIDKVGGVVDPAASRYMTNAPSVSTLVDRLAKGMQVQSLVDINRPARVAPFVQMEDNLQHSEDITTVLQTICSIFSGYYLQAFNWVADPKRVETLKILDSLNPHRGGAAWVGEDGKSPIGINKSNIANDVASWVSNESFNLLTPSNEANEDKPASMIYEQNNMAVGKLLCLDLETNSISENTTEEKELDANGNVVSTNQRKVSNSQPRSQKVYVLVKIAPTLIPQPAIVALYGKLNKPTDTSTRFDLYRSGAIRLRDLVFGCDLIDQHRYLLATDNSGTYKRIRETRKKNAMAAIKTGTTSMATASNILIISTETERQLARELNGKLSSPRVRNIIFEATYLMLLVVVNEQFGQVTIYTRGMVDPIKSSIRDLKSYEKNKGPDITEVLSTYVKATVPSL